MKESYQKLYALICVESEQSGFRYLAFSHEIGKLSKLPITVQSWYVGSPDKTNSPEIVRFTKESGWPRYQIREVSFLI